MRRKDFSPTAILMPNPFRVYRYSDPYGPGRSNYLYAQHLELISEYGARLQRVP